MNLSNYIDTMNLSLEERHRGDCPVCGGRNTFTATRTCEGILYNCYKAGCKLSGTRPTSVTVSDMKHKNNNNTKKVDFKLPEYLLPNRAEVTVWASFYQLDASVLNLLYDVKEHRVVFPVNYNGKMVDATGRALRLRQKPKWKRYGSSSYAYICGEGAIAVVVEDCISAATVSAISSKATGVALMGTSLLPDHLLQLQKYNKIIVPLDPDAAQKTFEFTRQLRGTVDTASVYALNLKDDLKYRRKADIINLNLLLSH